MVSLLSEFRATLPFLQLRSGERDQNIINEVGAAQLPRSGLVLLSICASQESWRGGKVRKAEVETLDIARRNERLLNYVYLFF